MEPLRIPERKNISNTCDDDEECRNEAAEKQGHISSHGMTKRWLEYRVTEDEREIGIKQGKKQRFDISIYGNSGMENVPSLRTADVVQVIILFHLLPECRINPFKFQGITLPPDIFPSGRY
jgi:hypothetical protein